jgi:DNA-binding MarR family transcriptional regulator
MATRPLLNSSDCSCLAVRQAARYITQFYDRYLAAAGLRTTQYGDPGEAHASRPDVDQHARRRIGRRSHDAWSQIRPLERDDLIAIEADPSDRRSKVLRLTKAGDARFPARSKTLGGRPKRARGTSPTGAAFRKQEVRLNKHLIASVTRSFRSSGLKYALPLFAALAGRLTANAYAARASALLTTSWLICGRSKVATKQGTGPSGAGTVCRIPVYDVTLVYARFFRPRASLRRWRYPKGIRD